MNWVVAVVAGAALIGWLVTTVQLRQAAAAAAAGEQVKLRLAAMEAQVATLRHDLNGILSPALLTADRLLTSPDPSVRRAGEVMVRTVDRATARLAETKF
jgi:signal transduction histidine kinase